MGQIKNSPLIEAIFELRWGEEKPGYFKYSKEETDFLPGLFYKAVQDLGFGYKEQLISNAGAATPDLPYTPKHRFQEAKDKWPCYQIGLGIFTANQLGNLSTPEKDDYDWDKFRHVIERGIESLNRSTAGGLNRLQYPKSILRYLDGFLLKEGDSFETFVSNQIKANFVFPSVFTEQEYISSNARDIKLELSYKTTRPEGSIVVSVTSAKVSGERAVVMDTTVSSDLAEVDLSVEYLNEWCSQAHDLQRYAFETLIKTNDL